MIIWGRLENNIADLLHLIATLPEAAPHLDRTKWNTISLQGKIDNWRKFYKNIQLLAPMKDTALQIIDVVADPRVSGMRILFTHGMWQGCASSVPLAFRIVTNNYEEPQAAHGEEIITLEQINHFTMVVHELTGLMTPLYLGTKIACTGRLAAHTHERRI